MIKGWIEGDAEVIARLENTPRAVQTALEKKVHRYALLLIRRVKSQKLSGQALNVRTGTLRRSINHLVIKALGKVTGIVGTNVNYAAKHEYGYSGVEDVRAHLRTVKMAWGRPIAQRSVNVRAHQRKVNAPANSFLRSALHEMRPQIMGGIQDAVIGAAVKGSA